MVSIGQLPPVSQCIIYVVAGVAVSVVIKVAVSLIGKVLDVSTARVDFIRRVRQHNRRMQTLVRFGGSMAILAVWLIVLTMGLKALGVNATHTVGAVGIIGLVVAGLFKDLVVDIVKGFEILSGGHYLVGDFVQVGPVSGHVIEFNIKSTRVRTPTGEEVTLPNSQCVPSRRYPRGYMNNYVDLVLAEPKQYEAAAKLLQRVGRDLNDANEFVREVPGVAVVLTRHEDHRPIVRWRVRTLPGCEALVAQKALPAIKRVFEKTGIVLAEEPVVFQLNGLRTLRELFNRRLNEQSVQEILEKAEKKEDDQGQT